MRLILLAAAFAGTIAACSGPAADKAQTPEKTAEPVGRLNVYSARHYDSDKAMYAAFEAETGYKVRVRESGAPQLLETMKAEGANSPADVILASDAGALYRFKAEGLTQAVQSEMIEQAIPARFRDAGGHMFGLAKRARVIVYDPDRLSPDQVDEYADLADPALKGDICMRSSSNIYNLSLMAEMIERIGEEAAADWAKAVAANFARPPQGADTTQIEAVAAGACSAALVNHYYWVRMAESGSDSVRANAEATALSFPRFADAGTHVNVTGASVAANAPHKTAALAFIEWLTTEAGQRALVVQTQEFALTAPETTPAGAAALSAFEESDMPLEVLGERQGEAQSVYLKAGWD